MRVWGWMVVVLWLPGRLLAAPEPPPPGDHPGAQYIDGTGCVFVRDGARWTARLDRDKQPVCGFPPSLAAETAESPGAKRSPEEILAAALAEGLRAGDLASEEAAPALAEVPPDPAQAALVDTLARAAALDDRLRGRTGPVAPPGFCARLGYRARADGETPTGDVTDGMCPDMVATAPGPVVEAAAPPEDPAATGPDAAERREDSAGAGPARQASAGSPAKIPAEVRSPARRASAAPRAPSGAGTRPAPARPAPVSAEDMIPAHARYVRIGVYADPAGAAAAAGALSRAGYPVAQTVEAVAGKPGRAVLAGPFSDRQALVRALNRLRADGYPRAGVR